MALRENKPEVTFHDGSDMPDPGFNSHSVSINKPSRLVFTSGIIAQRSDGTFPESIQEQAETVYKSLKAVLRNSGASPRDLIKVTFYVVDWSIEPHGKLLFALFSDFVRDEYGTYSRPTITLIPVTQLSIPGCKLEIEAVAVMRGCSSPYQPSSIQCYNRSVPAFKVDVVVIGGGFSGLQAAWDIQKAGLSCILLEAKHRIGGRSRSLKLKSGDGIVEMGATWINEKTQPKIYATAKRLGLDMVNQYTDGAEVWQLTKSRVIRADPESAEFEPIVKLNGTLGHMIEEGSVRLDITKPGDFPTRLDMSMYQWAAGHGFSDDLAQAATCFFTNAVVGRDHDEVGMHYFLDYVKSGLGFMSIASEGKDGAQSLKIRQGTSAIATGLADEMQPGSIFTNSPIDKIYQNDQGALVYTATGNQILARKVIIAIPTNTYEKISFSPPLPHDKCTLVARTKPGVYAKMILTYQSAWWKEIGLVGKFTSFTGPVCFSWDVSDDLYKQYSLAIFIAGSIAKRWAKLSELQRVEAVITHLSELVGSENGHLARENILEVNYVNWSEEDYLGGAPTSAMGPGLLSQYGAALRKPFKHLHFAGAETAYEWKGYLEGALRAGSRAAKEIIEWSQKQNTA